MPEKKAALLSTEMDPMLMLRFGLGGLATGASIATLVNLVHLINARKAEAKDIAERDKDTITVTLPGLKQAFVEGDKDEPTQIAKAEGAGHTHAKLYKRKFNGQFAAPSGDKHTLPEPAAQRVSKKNIPRHEELSKMAEETTKEVGWPALTAALLTAIAGSYGGAQLINSLYSKYRKNQLEKDVANAQNEYWAGIHNVNKSAALNKLFDEKELIKDAQSNTQFGYLDSTLATLALLGILGSAGTAYLTKRVLDLQNAREMSNKDNWNPPKVNRIIFRSGSTVPDASAAPEDKMASAEKEVPFNEKDVETLKAAFCVILDMVDGRKLLAKDELVKVALAAHGTNMEEIYKVAENQELERLFGMLEKMPGGQQQMLRTVMEAHPVMSMFKWTAGIPLVNKLEWVIAKQQLRKRMNNLTGETARQSIYNSPTQQEHNPFVYTKMPRQPVFKYEGNGIDAILGKSAQSGDVARLAMGGLAGKELADLVIPGEEIKKKRKTMTEKDIARMISNMDVEALDPQAAAFVEANKEKIYNALVTALSNAQTGG